MVKRIRVSDKTFNEVKKALIILTKKQGREVKNFSRLESFTRDYIESLLQVKLEEELNYLEDDEYAYDQMLRMGIIG